ncbi:MAG: hypothetical protein MUC96_26495 [Myxococcaceae bacterium]|jgi:hypothetical protein|nr:hypothetical protein [Myxococcaceae bacterium]
MRRRGGAVLCAVLVSTQGFAADPLEPIVVGPSPMVVLPPPVKRPINWEPFILTGAGAVMLGIGVWRLVEAESIFQRLRAIPASPTADMTNEMIVTRARQLAEDGKFNTGLGWVLLGLGAAAVGGSLLWVGTEGLLKDPIVRVVPGPGGVVVTGQF